MDSRQSRRTPWSDGLRHLRHQARRTSTWRPHPRLRVCKYDSITVSQFHISATSDGTGDDCFAYATITITHEEDQKTTDYLRKGLHSMIRTYETAVEETINPEQLAINPCVTSATRYRLYDRMMLATEEAWTYIRETRARVKAMTRDRGPHHEAFDSLHIPTASQSSNQHAPTPLAVTTDNTSADPGR